ncbi:hypothetical protein NliqN6_1917 [Naganishia liquefaciens]|uniref:OPT family oligopeptide transporter n=1 Tax=Naganishia liquefaciens TaxID=104408 RepID=A0A8H3TRX8_9TREE|nr:hypothetical protein NliqN6_1917 [Naganishia liquefaciens]
MAEIAHAGSRGGARVSSFPEEREEDPFADDELLKALEAEYGIEGDFTLRAVSVGLLVGVLLAFTNLYFGLQTGWISMMSLQSALLGYALFKLPRPRFLSRIPFLTPSNRPFSPQENVVLQTTAVATGTLPLAGGLVGIIPALEQLDWKIDGVHPLKLGYWQLIGWCFGICFFGVFLAVPLRKQVIVKEKLVFPSGTATAQLIALLHRIPPPSLNDIAKSEAPAASGGYQAIPRAASADTRRSRSAESFRHSASGGVADEEPFKVVEPTIYDDPETQEQMGRVDWWVLGWSFTASAVITFAAFLFPVIFAMPVFDLVGALFGTSLAASWAWWFSPSLSYVGQGIIMGYPTTISMNLGMITGWAILSPLAKHKGWAPGPVSSSTDGSRGWILWVSLAIMISESVISLLPIAISYSESIAARIQQARASQASARPEEDEVEPPERLVPLSWVSVGLAVSTVAGIVLVWVIFGNEGIRPWATALGLVLASILSVLGVRALGQTDLNPVSGIGKISQLVFAVLQPGNVVANIIAGGVAEAGAQQAGDLMQDLKTGALLKASPRSQFYGQMIGSLASVFVSVGAYKLYTRIYEIPGPEFRVPTAAIWLNLARLLNTGHLPPYTAVFMVAFGAIFALLSLIKYLTPMITSRPPRWIVYIPSGIAFAIGFLNTPSFSLARLIGGYIAYRTRKNDETPLLVIVCASGFVLGEGIISIVGLILTGAGQGAVSCWGCGLGGGGYCSGGC